MKNVPGKSLGQAMPAITKDTSTEPDEYETQNHLDTLMKAHKIMNNPVHLAAVHALAGRHQGAIQSIQALPKPPKSTDDLKAISNAKFGPSKGNSLGMLHSPAFKLK
jgi:hypothetical protein